MTLSWKIEAKPLLAITAIFAVFYWLPIDTARVIESVQQALSLTQWYAREHVILCLLPAFFIAGAIGVFVSKESVMRYLGDGANRFLAYGVASVSGTVLAVCSCTVLPLFAGIYRMGAGIGPATAFLYSGPAINVLAIILTGRILGVELGFARAIGAIAFSVLIGLAMQRIFPDQPEERANRVAVSENLQHRPLSHTGIFFALQVAILIFATWSKPENAVGLWTAIYSVKWILTGAAALGLAFVLVRWMKISLPAVVVAAIVVLVSALILHETPQIVFIIGIAATSIVLLRDKGEGGEWVEQSWGFAKQIMPLLFAGVLVSGFLFGSPGKEALIPSQWISTAVGGNSLLANFFASVAGALMYFATLTEVPILQGLMASGMGKGPALALLLAGPALSLPSMLVLNTLMGTKKTVVYVSLVVVMSTTAGMIFGSLF